MKSDIEQLFENAGVNFPNENSLGEKIIPDDDPIKLANFWNWFNGSKVVDEQGRPKVMYHGTPNAIYDTLKAGTYFTEKKSYADVYQSQGASSISYKREAKKPFTYSVYLKMKNPFDTRTQKCRKIFYDYYYGQMGSGTDLQDNGLPDWVDGEDLVEFLREHPEFGYDGLLLDEGGVGGYGEDVIYRGVSYITLYSNQAKVISNTSFTDSDSIYESNEYCVFRFNNKKYQNVDAEEVINEIIQRHNNFGKKINESTRMKKQALFSIPSSVPLKFFKITDNLNDVENWRVKILQNNSSENKRLGSFDSVGYIMVSLVDNTIIPIARSDEHHRGYEIMDTIYQDEYNINSSKYYPIFCLGNNYPYNQDEALKMKEALAKLKSYGYDLDKLNVSMYYITKGEDERYVTGNEFLDEIESKEEQRKNIPVTPLGKNLVKALEMFSNAFEYKNVRGELSLTKISNAWRQLYNIGKDIMLNKDDVLISWFDDETVSDLLQKYKDGYITEENLMNLVFGFGGIRQKIHNLLRRYHFSQVLVDELGNVDEVVNMIGAI